MHPIYRVNDIANYLRELLDSNASLADLWVEGELSNLSRSSAGHFYFTLKDERTQLRCVMFRGGIASAEIENGAQVVVHGRVSFYEARGDLQIYVDYVHAAGVGILHLQFERLKEQLEAEGLFDESRKRALPQFPRRIGVVTSPTGAVLHDIYNILGRRWPLAEVMLAPTPVQGDGSVDGIVAAIRDLNAEPEIDVIILARGGGSIEELWAFNEEAVARAVYASRVPVVSGIGHETDYTIVDYVADVRAPTPSASAELVCPHCQEVNEAMGYLAASLANNFANLIAAKRSLGERLYYRLTARAPDVEREQLLLSELWRRASKAIDRSITDLDRDVAGAAARLRALDPAATLRRGYSVVHKHGAKQVVSSTGQVEPGDKLDIHVADGHFPASVAKNYGF